MYCENCGNELSDEAIFCSRCGHKIGQTPNNTSKIEGKRNTNNSRINSNPTESKNKNIKYIVIGVFALALIITAGVFVIGNNGPASDGTVTLSDTCSIKTIGENVEVKNNKACWTIENENYTIYYGNYMENTNQYNTVIGLIEFVGIYGDHNGYGTYQQYYVISKSNGSDAILIKAKDKSTAETLADNIQFK